MDKQIVGSMFCVCAAILYAARHVGAAVLASGIDGNMVESYKANLQHIGTELLVFSIIALTVGLVYLGRGEYDRYTRDE